MTIKMFLPDNPTIKEQDEYCRLNNRAILIRNCKKAGYYARRVSGYACTRVYDDRYWNKGVWEDV